jgi:hypothetical protein
MTPKMEAELNRFFEVQEELKIIQKEIEELYDFQKKLTEDQEKAIEELTKELIEQIAF